MLGKGVDAAPGGDDNAVVELLRAVGVPKPHLADKQEERKNDAVGDKGGTHDEVGGALSEVVTLTEAQAGDATKDDLDPRDDRHGFANDAVDGANDASDAGVDTLLEMELEVGPDADLGCQEEHEDVGKLCMDVVMKELAAAVGMAKKVRDDGNRGA